MGQNKVSFYIEILDCREVSDCIEVSYVIILVYSGLAGGVAKGLFLALPVRHRADSHYDNLETVGQQKQVRLLSRQ